MLCLPAATLRIWKMAQYVCVLCEWIYDEELGDPKRGIAPGTKFADLPDDWECPECFAGKDEFELIEFGD
jgi:rubredoxin